MPKIVPTQFERHTSSQDVKVEQKGKWWVADFATFRDPTLFNLHCHRLGLKLRDSEIEHRRNHPDIALDAEFA